MKTVIYGVGPTALVFYHEVLTNGGMDIVAFCCAGDSIQETTYCDKPLVPFEEVERLYPPEDFQMLPMFGHKRMRDRAEAHTAAKNKGYRIPNYISAKANLEDGIEMGEGNVIDAFAHIGFGCTLGNGNIIRQSVYLGHQSTLGSFNIVSPGSVIGGKCRLHDLSFLGLNTTIATYAEVGTECLVGAGSLVTKSTEPYSVCFGSPAKAARFHTETGVMF